MKAIVILYDTLCRRFLSPYGCKAVATPNMARLADKREERLSRME